MIFSLNAHKVAKKNMPEGGFKVKEKAQPFYYHKDENETVAILFHGFSSSPHDMKELGDFLFEHGINVFGFRLAGHGTSTYDLMRTDYRDWVKSAEEAVEKVAGSHKRIFLVGYSFGANIALELAARYPKRFDGVVCLGTSIFLHMSRPTQAYIRYLNYVLRLLGKHTWRKSYVPKSKIEIWESTGNYSRIPLKSMLDWKHFIDHHTIKQVEKIEAPILIMHSRVDKISQPKSSEYLFEHVSSQYKELFILPELNHNPLKSESKDKIFTKVLDMIQS